MKTEQTSFNPTWTTDVELSKELRVHRCTIWAWARDGRIPKPVKIGLNRTRWNRAAVINALLNDDSI
ncbi:MAG: helix-turn-helix transcriptional regulator [Chromatocurvus sp.]